jgi:phosphatidate cytidylyltransferase
MKRVLTAVLLIPLVLLVVFRAPMWLFAVVVGVVVLLCLREYLDLVEGYGVAPLRTTTYIVSILLVIGTCAFVSAIYGTLSSYFISLTQILYLVMVPFLPLIFGIPVVFRRDLRMALAASAASAFGVLYIAISLTLLIVIRAIPGQAFLVVFILFSVWAGDIAAYYVGRSMGRHKLAPIVSPNKTWEGALASLIVSAAVAGLVFHFSQEFNRWFATLDRSDSLFYTPLHWNQLGIYSLGVVANIAAQMGDLFESAIKRGAQMKDSGSLLPGHGGILDRIDALLFAIPAVWFYALLASYLQHAIM